MRQPLPAPAFHDLSGARAPVLLDASAITAEGDNPVGRTVAELEILLAPLLTAGSEGTASRQGRSWPIGQTIGFIVVTCGVFWATAAYLAWSLL